MKQAMLDSTKFSFKGNSQAIEKYKAQVEALQNEVGTIVGQTFGCYDFKAKNQVVRVPKNWVIIL